jgi:penicillin-binding protein 1A
MTRGRAGGSRREPRFDDEGGYASGELRLAPEDRGRRPDPEPDHEPPRRGRDRHRRGKGRRGFFGTIFYWGLTLALWGAIALAGIIGYFAMKLPPIDQLAVPKRPPNVAILAADGTPMAFVSIEDRRFYSHFGIDPVGLARAVVRNASSGRAAEGGSTLTQQLAKNLFLTQERTLSRKIQEALLSLWLERNYSKDQILELYMNRVYFGSGAYGVEAASQRYFGKSARALTLGEAATRKGRRNAQPSCSRRWSNMAMRHPRW